MHLQLPSLHDSNNDTSTVLAEYEMSPITSYSERTMTERRVQQQREEEESDNNNHKIVDASSKVDQSHATTIAPIVTASIAAVVAPIVAAAVVAPFNARVYGSNINQIWRTGREDRQDGVMPSSSATSGASSTKSSSSSSSFFPRRSPLVSSSASSSSSSRVLLADFIMALNTLAISNGSPPILLPPIAPSSSGALSIAAATSIDALKTVLVPIASSSSSSSQHRRESTDGNEHDSAASSDVTTDESKDCITFALDYQSNRTHRQHRASTIAATLNRSSSTLCAAVRPAFSSPSDRGVPTHALSLIRLSNAVGVDGARSDVYYRHVMGLRPTLREHLSPFVGAADVKLISVADNSAAATASAATSATISKDDAESFIALVSSGIDCNGSRYLINLLRGCEFADTIDSTCVTQSNGDVVTSYSFNSSIHRHNQYHMITSLAELGIKYRLNEVGAPPTSADQAKRTSQHKYLTHALSLAPSSPSCAYKHAWSRVIDYMGEVGRLFNLFHSEGFIHGTPRLEFIGVPNQERAEDDESDEQEWDTDDDEDDAAANDATTSDTSDVRSISNPSSSSLLAPPRPLPRSYSSVASLLAVTFPLPYPLSRLRRYARGPRGDCTRLMLRNFGKASKMVKAQATTVTTIAAATTHTEDDSSNAYDEEWQHRLTCERRTLTNEIFDHIREYVMKFEEIQHECKRDLTYESVKSRLSA